MLHPSTRRFLKENYKVTHSVLQTLHGYVYMRWPVWYIGMCRGKQRGREKPEDAKAFAAATGTTEGRGFGEWLRRTGQQWLERLKIWFADGYHGKVMPPDSAAKLIRVERDIAVPMPESVLPYPRARDIILNANAAVALLQCPCRLTMENPCEPLDVCILVGDVVVDFVLAHHPGKARQVSPEEAVDVVRRCNERGMVTHAFFKEAVLDRFYAICNCCACCCGAMQGHFHGVPMLCSSGYVAQVRESACVRCGKCVRVCPFKAVDMEELPHIDCQKCMGCGVCTFACASRALSLAPREDVKPLVL